MSDEDEEPFERLASRMVDISGDGGVLKMVNGNTQGFGLCTKLCMFMVRKHSLFTL